MDNLVSLLSQSRSTSRFIGKIQNEMNAKGREVSTGKKDNIVKDLGGEIRNYLDLKSVHSSLGAREERLQTADNRLAQMGLSLETISKQAAGFDALASQIGLMDRSNIRIYSQQAKGMIESVQNAMNVQWGGRYLFSGDGVQSPALQGLSSLTGVVEDIINTHVADAGGTLTTQEQVDAMMTEIDSVFSNTHDTYNFDDLVYTGGTGNMAGIEIAERDVMSFGVKANDPEMRNLIQGLTMLSATSTIQAAFGDGQMSATNSLENSYLEKASALVTKGKLDTIDLQASLGFKQQRIGDTLDGIEQTVAHYEVRIGLFENADPYEAGVLFTALKTQLESSYYVTAQLSEQSLINYLR